MTRPRRLAVLVIGLTFAACSESGQSNKTTGGSEGSDSVGARLQRECESIIDTADALSSPIAFSNHDIIEVLAKDPKVRPKLGGRFYDNWQEYRTKHPEEWNAAYEEVVRAKQAEYTQVGRPNKIARCVLRRGMKEDSR